MAVPGSINELLIGAANAGAGGYEIERSVRFNSSDSAYLGATFGTPTDQDVFTLSMWVKRSALGSTQQLFGVSTNHSFGFTSGDALNLTFGGSSALTTTALFRDPAAWYHVVWKQNGTAHELYVNNVSVGTATATSDTFNTGVAHQIGAANTTNYLNGYLADVHFIDGQALNPTYFGRLDANGAWQPIAYAGTYGANGFHLPFSDNSTAAALGTDTSGNGNDWTVNNISVSPGADNDSLFDSPTNGTQTDTGAGGEVSGNYATWNQLIVTTNNTLSQGNLKADHAASTSWSGNNQQATSSMFVGNIGMSSGKWYWEVAINALTGGPTSSVGIVDRPGGHDVYVGYSANVTGAQGWGWGNTGTVYHTSGITNDGGTLSTYNFDGTKILGFALDMDNGRLYVSLNGTYENSGDPAAGTGYCASGMSGTYYFAGSQLSANSAWSGTVNTGQRLFAYAAPSGYKALCTTNLDDPTIADGSTAMDVALDTGADILTSTKALCGGSANFLWIKDRANSSTNHHLIDIVRDPDLDGTPFLASNSQSDEATLGTYSPPSGNSVGWGWYAGSSTVPNTDGSITSTVRANASAGFSIVSYTGNGTSGATVGHGLNAEPSMVIIKTRETAAANNWTIYHKSVGNTKAVYFDTNSFYTDAGYWNNTSPTSSVVTLGNFDVVNASSKALIMYAFAPVAGYSAIGSYTGNGSATAGAFAYTNFRPAWVLVKRADTGSAYSSWAIYDSTRSTFNTTGTSSFNFPLWANLSAPEGKRGNGSDAASGATNIINFFSNGFMALGTGAEVNVANETYVYMAFAENPFKTARAR